MQVEQTILSNGLVVISRSSRHLESASIGAFVNVGSRQETKANNGIAHFCEHLMFKGTSTRSAYDISKQIEVLGSDINAFTGMDLTAYYATGLATHIDQSIEIIGDAVTDSLFAPPDIALESGVILQEISQHEDRPMSVMQSSLQAISYPKQPFGQTILGSAEFVSNAVPSDFRSFTEQYYTADNIVVAGAGGFTHDAFVRKVEDAFAKLPTTATRPSTVPASYVGGTMTDRRRDFKQVSVGIGFDSVSLLDDTMYHHVLLADAFGGAMSSPLFTEIREKRGLVYSTSSYASMGVDNGRILITGAMAPDKVEEFITIACMEFRKMCTDINETDLLRAKNSHLVSIATLKEKPFSTACFMARSYWQRGYVRNLDEIRAAIQTVTLDDLKVAAQKVLTSTPSIVLIGPAPSADYGQLVRTAIA